jgi:hypothetical protein
LHERFIRIWLEILPLSRARRTEEAMTIWNAKALVASKERAKAFGAMSDYGKSMGTRAARPPSPPA